MTLDVRDRMARIALVPCPIERLGHEAELDDEVGGQVLGFDFAALFPPQAQERAFIRAHDDAGVGPADEMAADTCGSCYRLRTHDFLQSGK